MRAHHLGALVAAAVLAVVAGFWTTSLREPDTSAADSRLLAGLEESVNDVTTVKLTGPGNETFATLTRGEETWRLAEKGGHRADVPKVRELLLSLSRAKLLEEKTSNPEFYERLGVEDIAAADAGGVLVELEGVGVPSVIIGNVEYAREAVYARRAGEPASWLASGRIEIATDTLQWLGRNVIDISASRIAEVEISHPDGEVVLISKAAFGQPNFDVANIPADRELERANIANPIAGVLDGLSIDDVLLAEGSGFSELAATRATFRAFDGYVVHADAAEKDGKYYVQFSAATDAATAARYLPASGPAADAEAAISEVMDATTGVDATDMGPTPDTAAPPEADLSVVTEEAEKQNKAFAGWVYVVPKLKYDQMTRRMADLLKDPA